MSTTVEQVLETYDALSESDKHRAAVEILRRYGAGADRDVPERALVEVADELFQALDTEEAAHASR